MKRVLFILAVILLIASCSKKQETVDINSIELDTLRVKVLILNGDTLTGTTTISDDIEELLGE